MEAVFARWRTRPLLIDQSELLILALKHEPGASSSKPSYRMATCVACGRRIIRCWHVWLVTGGFKKEVHLCARCGRDYQ